MASPVSTSSSNLLVVTHAVPANLSSTEPMVCVGMQKFRKGYPLALGTVQIMTGLMVLLFGVVMAIYPDTLSLFSGIFVWGAAFYVTAGSLTVASGKVFNRCLMNTTLGFNVVASVVSVTALILYCLDAAGVAMYCYSDYWACSMYLNQKMGDSGVLAVFHLLELIVSITVAAFACRATCDCSSQPPCVYVIPANEAPPTCYATPASATQPPPQVLTRPEGKTLPGLTEPPAYTVIS